jgi:hypothetical protein
MESFNELDDEEYEGFEEDLIKDEAEDNETNNI